MPNPGPWVLRMPHSKQPCRRMCSVRSRVQTDHKAYATAKRDEEFRPVLSRLRAEKHSRERSRRRSWSSGHERQQGRSSEAQCPPESREHHSAGLKREEGSALFSFVVDSVSKKKNARKMF